MRANKQARIITAGLLVRAAAAPVNASGDVEFGVEVADWYWS